jgi:hypothetical protein
MEMEEREMEELQTDQKVRYPYFRISPFRYFGLARKAEISISCPSRSTAWNGHTVRGCRLVRNQKDGPVAERAAETESKTLNFKVSLEFKKEFKGFAVSQGITMTDLLKEGFALSKNKRQK